MKIALVGYGKMGQAVERIAVERGHAIVSKVDIANQGDFELAAFRSADVAIEFTTPQTAFDNYIKCFNAGLPVVSGTTGWLDRLDEIKERCTRQGNTFFYASNFSIGVNIFFALNRYLAKIMNRFPTYDVALKEIHHVHKKDAPSGTAITLAQEIIGAIDRKISWQLVDSLAFLPAQDILPIEVLREGEVPGYHEVTYRSAIDIISIAHNAETRDGFALGAVLAAEFVPNHAGAFLTMNDLFRFDEN
ncbi:MAG: 4-hydroxy-tetrahydrodipicolinate reductase [Tannerellaceae bacterium]|jgi:4-hydroxy-tetrahydrodipicolinate reductase|nr:4-hydroxy-tetrahydrodipicolinate reductase [Tannerellaceae bacterium]